MARVLVVDDEAGVRESLRLVLAGECEVVLAAGVDEALRAAAGTPPDLVLLDLTMPGRSGFELLEEWAELPDRPPVVVLTASTSLATAVAAMKQGATDFVTKPFEVEALRIKVRQLLERRDLEREVVELRARVEARDRLEGLVGGSESMQRVFRSIRRVAGSRSTVLIRGESGTGKELAARALHERGPRRRGPFVAVNCAGIPETLMESELFGHERGAFTDARERRLGRFEQASGGTLFLDEIGELPAAVQGTLLRVLQERRVDRVGGTRPVEVDVRVVAATHRDLEHDVAAGRFRADLFYRINVVPLHLPPLRERPGDIRQLAEHFLAPGQRENDRPPKRLASETLALLERYPWPGNVRELANAMEHAMALAEGEALEPEDLPEAVRHAARGAELREAARAGVLGLDGAVAHFERELLREALDLAGWNQTRAASELRITRRALKLKMDRHGLKREGSGD